MDLSFPIRVKIEVNNQHLRLIVTMVGASILLEARFLLKPKSYFALQR